MIPNIRTNHCPHCKAQAKTIEALQADNVRLNALVADTAEHWMALQFKHPIQWEGAIDSAMAAACAEIEALKADKAKLREEFSSALAAWKASHTRRRTAALQETGQ